MVNSVDRWVRFKNLAKIKKATDQSPFLFKDYCIYFTVIIAAFLTGVY